MKHRCRSSGLLVLEIHRERSMITLGPGCESANVNTGETVHPFLGNKAVVQVEWRGLFPLVLVSSVLLHA